MTPAPLNTSQERFLLLHSRTTDPVMRWQWLFCGSTLRAYSGRGEVATVNLNEFAGLVDAGMVEQLGCAGAKITDAGRARVCQ